MAARCRELVCAKNAVCCRVAERVCARNLRRSVAERKPCCRPFRQVTSRCITKIRLVPLIIIPKRILEHHSSHRASLIDTRHSPMHAPNLITEQPRLCQRFGFKNAETVRSVGLRMSSSIISRACLFGCVSVCLPVWLSAGLSANWRFELLHQNPQSTIIIITLRDQQHSSCPRLDYLLSTLSDRLGQPHSFA